MDISEVLGQVQEVLDNSITGVDMPNKPVPLIDLSKIDFGKLRDRFNKSKHKNTDLEQKMGSVL